MLQSSAQNIYFSQYQVSKLLINPANTGAEVFNYNVSAIYRSQWYSSAYPFVTTYLEGEVSLLNRKEEGFSIGLMYQNDRPKQGIGIIYDDLRLSSSYQKKLGILKNRVLALGINVGYNSRRIDASNLLFEDAIRNETTISQEQAIIISRYSSLDVASGVSFASYKNPKKLKSTDFYKLGFAIPNLLVTSRNSFFPGTNRAPIFYTLFANGRKKIAKQFYVLPNLLLMNNGVLTNEISVGADISYKIPDEYRKNRFIYIGTKYRIKNAYIITSGVTFDNFRIYFSYDFNTAQVSKLASSNGTVEVGLSYHPNKKRVIGGLED